jgi:hypothetical protein
MSNHRRARTRGHDTNAAFRIAEERAAARGEKVQHAEKRPKDISPPDSSRPDRSHPVSKKK